MWEEVHGFVKENHMLEDGDYVLAGLSGGADSVCLLRYLLWVQKKIHIKIAAVHVNHQLRGSEAERDERFAGRFCEYWQIPFAAVKRDVAEESARLRCSLEEAGRLARYDCFDMFAGKWGCNKIAVAHHKNDLAETVLFRMARGTSLRGLAGIRPVTGNIIRPLLCLTREKICAILNDLGQEYVEDSTNMDDAYSRNFIRHCLLPDMRRVNPAAVEHLAHISRQAAEIMDYLELAFQKIYEENVLWKDDCCLLPLEAAALMHPAELSETVRRMIAAMAGGQKDISAVHVEQVAGLFGKRPGKYLELPFGLTAERKCEGVALLRREAYLQSRKDARQKAEEEAVRPQRVDMERLEREGSYEIDFPGGGHISFRLEEFHGGDIEKNDCVKYFAYDRIKSTLCLRSRKTGDYFVVDKGGRHKSLRRYFIDEKIPAGERDAKILLTEGSHVLWVLGGRISEAYRVEPDTKTVLVVRAEDKIIKSNSVK